MKHVLMIAFLPLVDKRYKSFHKYEYLYEAESLNALNGAVNGPRVTCKVCVHHQSSIDCDLFLLAVIQRKINLTPANTVLG